jgi:hypothetical protein
MTARRLPPRSFPIAALVLGVGMMAWASVKKQILSMTLFAAAARVRPRGLAYETAAMSFASS